MDSLFQSNDLYQPKIDKKIFKKHNTRDNAWIRIDTKVYSIQNNDEYLLDLCKEHYGKNIKSLLTSFDTQTQNDILHRLSFRYIGQLNPSSSH